MERQLTQREHPPPRTANLTRQASNARDSDHYTPVREVYLRENEMDQRKKRLSKTDREMSKYEEYLRNKWGCHDAIPDPFDPEKLDAALRSRFPAKSKQERPLVARERVPAPLPQPGNQAPAVKETNSQEMPPKDMSPTSEEMIHASAAIDTDKQEKSYESEVSSDNETSSEKHTTPPRGRSSTSSRRGRSTSTSGPDATDRPRTPRIRAGSKPPLSRSAFVAGGVPCEHGRCQGECKRDAGRRAKAPAYFPFKSRARSRSKSRGGQSQNQT
ncbi:hypothetical protein F5B22DRAFT_228026 [Xylaria bambusicola]|uniref:uncharacterized protein n=1 Tax=Xylaria bambusicola TaxID=326684 RepID=UPI0020088929|nr:uncharacterized protein F5B22DRAFT_228026 [Xylaria bambusicola]KAI0514701.1 hypothetical protein F5B22DRAFT_228026 [Xylaria bambusicola]